MPVDSDCTPVTEETLVQGSSSDVGSKEASHDRGNLDNVIGDVTFPICHNDNYDEFNRIKYYNFAKYLPFTGFNSKFKQSNLICFT